MRLEGSWVALVTPFYKGEIDWKSLEGLVRWHLEAGTHGIVACGTTAETATLSEKEQWEVLQRIKKVSGGKMHLMAGCGTYNTAKTISKAKEIDGLGFDALLVVTPYYNRPTQRGLKEHFCAIAKAVKTPIVIYNVPSRTGVNMEPSTVLEVARIHHQVAGIKEASGILDQASWICREAPAHFAVLSGDDSLTLPMLAVGARGVISVAANVMPEKVAQMIANWLSGEIKGAKRIHLDLMPLFRSLFIETNPIPTKAALWKMNRIKSPELRLPLVGLSLENETKLEKVLLQFGCMVNKGMKGKHFQEDFKIKEKLF